MEVGPGIENPTDLQKSEKHGVCRVEIEKPASENSRAKTSQSPVAKKGLMEAAGWSRNGALFLTFVISP